MKKVLALAGFVVMSLVGFAQSHDVSINLAPMLSANFSAQYFYNFEDNQSVGIMAGYQNFVVRIQGDTISRTGPSFAPEYRYFFDTRDNDKFFIGGYLKFRSYTGEARYEFDNAEYKYTNTGLAIGLTFGRLWITRSGFFFNVWNGLGYYMIDNTKWSDDLQPITEVESSLPSLDWRLGISLGWRFE